MEEINETMATEEFDNNEELFDEFDEDQEIEESAGINPVKVGLIGVAAAAAVGGIAVIGKKFIAPKLGSAKEKFTDWREERKELKAAKKEAKAAQKVETEYIKVEPAESKQESEEE